MTDAMTDILRYPIGKYAPPASFTPAWRSEAIETIALTPSRLRAAIAGLSGEQLDTPYRPGGWTVRQVVHHVPDSHVNAYVRLKLALTEDKPTIKPYEESRWATLADAETVSIDTSLQLLEALHLRFVALWRAMSEADFQRRFVHPESGEQSLDYLLGLYAWHGPHHTAHITSLRSRMGW